MLIHHTRNTESKQWHATWDTAFTGAARTFQTSAADPPSPLPPVLTGHVSSLLPYLLDTSRPSSRTNWTRRPLNPPKKGGPRLCHAARVVPDHPLPRRRPRPPPPPSSFPRTNRTRRVPLPVLIGHAASLTPRRFLPVVRGLAIADDAWGALMGHLEACIHTGGDKLAEGAMGAVRPLPCTPPFPY